MAEEQDKAQDAAEDTEEKKPKKKLDLKPMLIPVIASAVTAGIVGVIFAVFLAPKPQIVVQEGGPGADGVDSAMTEGGEKKPGGKEGEGEGEEASKASGIFLNYDPFVVSIFDRERVHYLKVVLSLELSNEKIKETINAKSPQIRDTLIFVLSDFTLRELLDNQAKNLLKQVMIKNLNEILGKDQVINVYFTEFTIQ